MTHKDKILEHAIANALTDAANYPKNIAPHVLGANMRKTIDVVKEAVVNTGLYIIGDNYLQAHEQVTRVEVIDNSGRAYVKYGVSDVITALQDDGRTLKLFLRES